MAMKRKRSLFERHIIYGIRRFGSNAMKSLGVACHTERNRIESKLPWRGHGWIFASVRGGGRIRHLVMKWD